MSCSSSRISSRKTRARELSALCQKLMRVRAKAYCSAMAWEVEAPVFEVVWVQEAIRNEQIQVVKIPRDSNAADVLASASGVTDFAKHIHGMGGCWTAVDN